MSRPPWGHVSRHCVRCGNVGPRVFSVPAGGYIHAYCRTEQEKRDDRKERYESTKAAKAAQIERSKKP